jgi:hypothetical protein
MAKLGKPIDLTAVLKRPYRQRVSNIGVELEGGWDDPPEEAGIIRDGSISGLVRPISAKMRARFDLLNLTVSANRATPDEVREWKKLYQKVQSGNALTIGEVPSPVLSTDRKNTHYWVKWIEQFYPSASNETCGLHVHLSFRQHFTYQRLMVPEFPATILKGIEEWALRERLDSSHPIWPRLAGKSEYCQHTFFADLQAKDVNKDFDHHREGNRYSVVAYRWARHQTIECRLLPMFDTVQQAIRAIEELIRLTNLFLLATRRREEKVISAWKVDDDRHVDRLEEWI